MHGLLPYYHDDDDDDDLLPLESSSVDRLYEDMASEPMVSGSEYSSRLLPAAEAEAEAEAENDDDGLPCPCPWPWPPP
jgi:hypothetical protein